MISPERKTPPSLRHEFQPLIEYRDIEKSSTVITKQTYELLELFYQGLIRNPKLARDYFQDYTFFYLRKAEEGADTLYDREGASYEDLDLETSEIAQHAFIVFAHLPDDMTSRFLPMGFSRRGMLRAPETKEEYLKRIKEIKIGLWQVVDGEMKPQTTLEAYPCLLRTYGFFKVGSKLPIKIVEDERGKRQMEEERLNDLLEGVDVSL